MSDYIISEEQLQFYIKEPRYTQRQDMATQIRSRTLSEHDPIRLNTQPEGCDCRDCQRYRKDECPYPGSNPTIYICNSFLMDVKEHDAKVAKAEREKLLKLISGVVLDAMNERSFTDSDGDYFQCSQLSKDEIDIIIESLRSKP